MDKGREAGRSLMKKVLGQERILTEHLDGLERNGFYDFEKSHKRAYQKGKIESNEQSRREASRNGFVEKGGMPDRVKSIGEIDSRQNHMRARPGFVKPIRNGLRKEQNLIECRPSRAETGLAGKENGMRFQKEE